MKKLVMLIVFILGFQTSVICQFDYGFIPEKIQSKIGHILEIKNNLINTLNKVNGSSVDVKKTFLSKTSSLEEGGIKTTLVEEWRNDAWVNHMLTTFSFDLNNSEVGFFVKNWENNEWVNSIKKDIVMNEQNYPILDSLLFWENQKWKNKIKSFYTYNSKNEVTEVMSQQWNDTTKQWVNLIKQNMLFSDDFYLMEMITSTGSDTGWTPMEREFYNYDEITKLCTDRKTQIDMGDEWIDLSRITYNYNDKKLCTEELGETWIFFQFKWAKSLRYQYEYNNLNQEIVKYIDEWDVYTSEQTVYQKISTSYTDEYIAEELTQEWGDTDWVNTDLNNYTYKDDQMTLNIWQKWDSINSKWYNFERWTNTYGNPVSIKNTKYIPESFSLSQNYPNPFNPTTTIKYSIPKGNKNISSVQLKVYDLLGKEIITLVNENKTPGNYEVVFDASKLTSGIYYYSLNIGNKTQTKKCLLIK